MRHTKIVATAGPASHTDAAIAALVAAGVDVFRLNFSHGTHDEHARVLERIRAASARAGRHVAVLQDLSGPKIRTGRLRGGAPLQLHPGEVLRIAVGTGIGEPGHVWTGYESLPRVVRAGDTLLLDDGRIELRVEAVGEREVRTVVVDGGPLGEHKGINLPGVDLPSEGLTPKDADDLAFGLRIGVDLVALSFVQSAEDLRQARETLRTAGAAHVPLVAKLERPQAIARLEEVLAASDAVMVARGDLGLELPLERVPRVQKEVIRRARARGVPVIVATQVLESMRTEPRPTRAEVSDAAHAVDDRVDAIMLAGETAVGAYPVRAVEMLDRVIRDAETVPPVGTVALEATLLLSGHGRAICQAALTLADRAEAAAIVAVTRGGRTARVLSALRPRVPVFAATDRPEIANRLVLSWGVVPVLTTLEGDVNAAAARIGDDLVTRGAIARGSVIVLVSVVPDLARGPSNFLKLERV